MAGSRRFPTRWSGSGPCSASGMPGRCWLAASSRASRRGCGTPSGGWTRRQVSVPDPKPQSAEMVVVDDEEFRRLPGTIELYRAALALARGDVPGTVRHARRALELSPEEDHLRRASAAGLLGLASWASGDLEAGHRAYAECMAGLQRAGHVADAFGCAIALADIRRSARSSRRGDAHLRAGTCSLHPSRAGRCCGERRTCTSG